MEIIYDATTKEYDDVIICPCCYEETTATECRHCAVSSLSTSGERKVTVGHIFPTRCESYRKILMCPKCGSRWYTDPEVTKELYLYDILSSVQIGCALNIFQSMIWCILFAATADIAEVDSQEMDTVTVLGVNVGLGLLIAGLVAVAILNWFICGCIDVKLSDHSIPTKIKLKTKGG